MDGERVLMVPSDKDEAVLKLKGKESSAGGRVGMAGVM